MKLRYIGPSFGVDGLTDGKIYECLGVEDGLLRIIDDSDEGYLYSVIPGPMYDPSITGKWDLVEDDGNGTLASLLQRVEIALQEEKRNGGERRQVNLLEL